MTWPGIEQWLETPHRHELVPLVVGQLVRLAEAGWEIGSHSRAHPQSHPARRRGARAELRESRLELERQLGRPCRSVAYPYGDVDERVIAAARDAGYVTGAALPPRFHAPRHSHGRGSASTAATTSTGSS